MASQNNTHAYSAGEYNNVASFVYSAQFTSSVLQLLDAKLGERIIDLGCGSGELDLELQRLVGSQGLVVATDASPSMVEQATSNGVSHTFVGDAQDLHFPAGWSEQQSSFDAVFTNAALHWCKRDPAGVLRSVKSVLRSGGRFVGEFGGFTNCIGVRSALHHVLRKYGKDPVVLDPWYFPSDVAYRSLLEEHGFRVVHISLNPRLTPLKGGVYEWVKLFARGSFLAGLPDEEAETIMREVESLCQVDCRDDQGNWSIMYTRLRFHAVMN